MNLGLGVFLSSLFLGTVLLYLKTRDTWKWRLIWRRIGFTIGGLIAITVLWFAAILGYEKWEGRPQIVTELHGVGVGERFSDVVFKLGQFTQSASKGAVVEPDEPTLYESNDDKHLALYVKAGAIAGITYICKTSDYKKVNGISCTDKGNDILGRFGNSVRIRCLREKSEDAKLHRVYDVPEFGVRYSVLRNQVAGFLVMSPKALAVVSTNWMECS